MDVQIPAELGQLITLALGVSAVTGLLKMVATNLGGKGAVAVSGVIALALTALGFAAGWIPFVAPTCDLTALPFGCAQEWVTTAGAAMAIANVLYVTVYERVFNPTQPAPVVTVVPPGPVVPNTD